MKTALLLLLLAARCFGAPVTDDLSRIETACGKPVSDVQTPPRLMAPGAKLRTLTYGDVALHLVGGVTTHTPGYTFASAERGTRTVRDKGTTAAWLPCLATVWAPAIDREASQAKADEADEQRARDDRTGSMVIGVAFLVAGVLFYFLPIVVASSRKVASQGGIVLLNIFLGWTVLGWLVALIWACSAQTEDQVKAQRIDYDRLAAAVRGQSAPPPNL